MSRVFPKMTKCSFHKFGPSGTVEKFDGLCVLPLNIINEKIYLFLWFWFIFVAVLSALHIVYRLVLFFWHPMRDFLLRSRCRSAKAYKVRTVCQHLDFGDWFLLYQLTKNMDTHVTRHLVGQLFNKFNAQ